MAYDAAHGTVPLRLAQLSIRRGETWRNLVNQLERIKVVEYDHNGARVRQIA
jgi:hypothetical protein